MNERVDHKTAYSPTEFEHVANIVTHGAFVIPSLVATSTLISLSHSPDHYYCSLVYGVALTTLFLVSTVFHCISYYSYLHKHTKFTLRKWKDAFHIFDRAAIYVYIAGSYTPWLVLREMEGTLGIHMRWIVWMLCLFGISYQYTFHEQYKWLEIAIYVFTGVFPALAAFSMVNVAGVDEVLGVAGVSYLIGIVFFKMDGRVPCAHAIWHLFVVFAASSQWTTVYSHLYGDLTANNSTIVS